MSLFSCMYYFAYKPETFAFALVAVLASAFVATRAIIRFILEIQPFDPAAVKKIRKSVYIGMCVLYAFYLLTMGFVYYYT